MSVVRARSGGQPGLSTTVVRGILQLRLASASAGAGGTCGRTKRRASSFSRVLQRAVRRRPVKPRGAGGAGRRERACWAEHAVPGKENGPREKASRVELEPTQQPSHARRRQPGICPACLSEVMLHEIIIYMI